MKCLWVGTFLHSGVKVRVDAAPRWRPRPTLRIIMEIEKKEERFFSTNLEKPACNGMKMV